MQLRLGSGGSGAAKLDVWMNSCSNSAKPSRPMHKFDPDNPGGQYSLDLGSSYDNAVATELAQMARNQPDTVVWEQVTYVRVALCCASRCRCVRYHGSRASLPTALPPTALLSARYNMLPVTDWDIQNWLVGGLPQEGMLDLHIK